jgi:hypothetical protein
MSPSRMVKQVPPSIAMGQINSNLRVSDETYEKHLTKLTNQIVMLLCKCRFLYSLYLGAAC